MSDSPSPLSSFVPRLLLRLMDSAWAAPRAPDEALRCSLPSGLLFLDVSGFTSLTESVANRGPSGLEQLHLILNRYFSSLLNTIHAHGGDLLKVAGDALVVAFHDGLDRRLADVDQPVKSSAPFASLGPLSLDSASPHSTDSLASLAHRTIRCALALLNAPDISTAGVTLRPHIGVTSGLVHFIAVGGEQYPARGEELAYTLFSPIRHPTRSISSSSVIPADEAPSVSLVAGTEDSVPPLADSPPRPGRVSISHPLTVTVGEWSDASTRSGAWEFLACGPAFDHLNSVVAESRTGEVVVDAETWKKVALIARIEGQRVHLSDNFRVTACAGSTSPPPPMSPPIPPLPPPHRHSGGGPGGGGGRGGAHCGAIRSGL